MEEFNIVEITLIAGIYIDSFENNKDSINR